MSIYPTEVVGNKLVTLISLGVTALSFVIVIVVKQVLGVDI